MSSQKPTDGKALAKLEMTKTQNWKRNAKGLFTKFLLFDMLDRKPDNKEILKKFFDPYKAV